MKKYKILKVTYEIDYIIDMHDDKISKINGWTIKQIIEDWFKNHNVASDHATRDGHEVGGSRKFIKAKVINIKE